MPPPSGSTTTNINPANPEGPVPSPLRHLNALLQASVSATHFSKLGTTPLMAFIEHIPDDYDDKAKTLRMIFKTLIQDGASIEARNRQGETALLVAARLGRKVALATLVEMGANIHVRDIQGKGVLDVLDWRGGMDRIFLRARLWEVVEGVGREWKGGQSPLPYPDDHFYGR